MYIRTKNNSIINLKSIIKFYLDNDYIMGKSENQDIIIYYNKDEVMRKQVYENLISYLEEPSARLISIEALEGKKAHLYFQDNGMFELLGVNLTEAESNRLIIETLENLKFKYHYFREWFDEKGNKWIDYGSHTNFFVWGNNIEQ